MMSVTAIMLPLRTKQRWLTAVFAAIVSCSLLVNGVIDQEGNNFGYEARTNVGKYLKLAFDIRDMRLNNDTIARNIYTNGSNVPGFSLQELSLTAKEEFGDTPMFLIYQEAFDFLGANLENDTTKEFDGAPIEQYADTLVMDLFKLDAEYIEASGALVLNVMQVYWGNLWKVYEACQIQDGSAMDAALDAAVALYVGSDQIRKENNKGYMLYNMAEFAGAQFGQDPGETVVNARTLSSFVELQSQITDASKCQSADGQKAVRDKVLEFYKYSNTFLMQMLLFYVSTDGVDGQSDYMELFSLALWPQIHICDPILAEQIETLTIVQDVSPTTRPQIIAALKEAFSCLHITCEDIGALASGSFQCTDVPATNVTYSTYTAASDVRRFADIDKDIEQISTFMKNDAWDTAMDFYLHGRNSDFSLSQIASRSLDWTDSSAFELFKTYLGEADYTFLDKYIQDLISNASPMNTLSSVQRKEAVEGFFTGILMFLAILGHLEESIDVCDNTEGAGTDEMLTHWDAAAAMFVGGMQAVSEDGQVAESGLSIYGLSRDLCNRFGKCEQNSSASNAKILLSLSAGVELMKTGNCDEAVVVIEDDIKPVLLEPLIQAYLANTLDASIVPQSDALGRMFAYSNAILPFVDEVDKEYGTTHSVAIRNNNNFINENAQVQISLSAAFESIRNSLAMMGLECADLGSLTIGGVPYGVCTTDDIPEDVPPVSGPDQDTTAPTKSPGASETTTDPIDTTDAPVSSNPPDAEINDDFAWGRYPFKDQKRAMEASLFALDIRDMYLAKSTDAAETVYTSPSAYATNGTAGGKTIVTSLEDMSTKAYLFMREDPIYNFFRLALFDDISFDEDNGDTVENWSFTDAVEKLAIKPENGNSATLAAETVVVMGTWHMIAHNLYEAARRCKKGMDAPELIDTAVGLWIGQDQEEGKFDSGWLMYAIAQKAYKNLGQPEVEGESIVNGLLMDQFVQAQTFASQCSTDADVPLELSLLVDDILRNLAVPLIHNLLYHISEDNYQEIQLYALSVVPQAVSCDTGVFEFLRDILFQGYTKDENTESDLIENLGKFLTCMGFRCSDFPINTDSASIDLSNLISELCDQLNFHTLTTKLSSYEMDSPSAFELARLDLDVLQVHLFTRAKEYRLALDIFENGRNSRTADNKLNTLKGLTNLMNEEKIYGNTIEAPNYAETIVGVLTDETVGEYAGATRAQKAEVIHRILQTGVTYAQVLDKLYEALNSCDANEDGKTLVDEAAALFIGSIEGQLPGGNPTNSGTMMYALGKEVCVMFNNKCESHGDAKVNSLFMFAMEDVKKAIASGECDTASAIVEDTLIFIMPVSLVQGVAYFADVNEDLSWPGDKFNETIATGAALSESLIPFIAKVNQDSADIVSQSMEFSQTVAPVNQGKQVVFDAISSALTDMGIDCNSVGSYGPESISLCQEQDNDTAPADDTPTNLGDDLYVATTYVQDKANIALDVQKMVSELTDDRQDMAEFVYKSGEHSEIYDENGKRIGYRSLDDFSLNAAQNMKYNPLYQMTVFALRDENDEYLGKSASTYADSLVQEAFKTNTNVPLAAEAAVALNLWMELANELYKTAKDCKDGNLGTDDGIHAIDGAAAYWIGDGQIAGDADKGHLLYALAEEMGDHFGTTTNESRTNHNILLLFHQVKMQLSQPNACAEIEAARGIRRSVDKIISTMIAVQAQALIHYLRSGDKDRVRIHANAFVPLVVGCSPSKFEYLAGHLLDGQYQETQVDEIVAAIRSTFPCFGITCDDVGIHSTEQDTVCSDPSELSSLTGYKPSTDVREYAQLDLDILELDILMQMEAYEAAEDLYMFGKHSSLNSGNVESTLSLHTLATSSGRSVVPQFATFKRHFGNDENYADFWISSALDENNAGMKPMDRWAVVVGASQYMVMYMAALQSMNEAISACSSGDGVRESTAAKNWDKAAAFIIGSLEGTSEIGSQDGRLFWQMGKEFCGEFGTCSVEVPGSSRINDRIDTLLYSGRGAIIGGGCDQLRKATRELAPALLVPLIQGCLSTAAKLANRNTPASDKSRLQAEAAVYASALLPLIEAVSPKSAKVIEENFRLDGPILPGGLEVVVSAFSDSLSQLNVDCGAVGSSNEIDVCTGTVENKTPIGLIVGIVLGTVAVVGFFLLFRRRKKNLPENKPRFKASPGGELNHTSELLAKRTADKGRSSAETDLLNGADADATMPEDDDAYVNAISQALNDDDAEEDDKAVPQVV